MSELILFLFGLFCDVCVFLVQLVVLGCDFLVMVVLIVVCDRVEGVVFDLMMFMLFKFMLVGQGYGGVVVMEMLCCVFEWVLCLVLMVCLFFVEMLVDVVDCEFWIVVVKVNWFVDVV